MGDMTDPRAQIRPFADRRDYERMVDYFLTANDAFLEGMGVDRQKLPQRAAWLQAALLDHERGEMERERYYLAWIYDGIPIGHSSINKIKFGDEAFIHLHLWVSELRRKGLGTQYFRASAAEFMRAFRLQRLFCEPFADNLGPNCVLRNSGFRFVKTYRTVPGSINLEQDVNQYVLERTYASEAQP